MLVFIEVTLGEMCWRRFAGFGKSCSFLAPLPKVEPNFGLTKCDYGRDFRRAMADASC
jgi:hypothetical protein